MKAVFFLLLLAFVTQVWSRGVVRVKFLRYENPGGRDEKGKCCDGLICKKNTCDHMFTICLDDISRLRLNVTGEKDCRYGHYETEEIDNLDTVSFGTRIANINNPLEFSFERAIPRELGLRILVEDHDTAGSNDRVELLKYRLVIPASYVQSGRPFSALIQGRTKLNVEVSVSCAANYYGADCSTLCRAPTSTQHYYCDQATGAKRCQPGWMGPSCTQQALHRCPARDQSYCKNGGLCVIYNNAKVCQCPENFSGNQCQSHACEQRCSNGRCSFLNSAKDAYKCICDPGYQAVDSAYGQYCEASRRG